MGPSRAKQGLDSCPGQGKDLCRSVSRSFLSFLDPTCFFGAGSTSRGNDLEGTAIVKRVLKTMLDYCESTRIEIPILFH